MSARRYQLDSHAVDVAKLAQPLQFEFSKRTAPNRLVKTAMSETLASWHPTTLDARGLPTKELIELYKRWGESTWGIITTGEVMIDYEHITDAARPTITISAPFHGERFEGFQALAVAMKRNGSIAIAQVCHPGRSVREVWVKETISASPTTQARAATVSDIENITQTFAHVAAYLEAAGFDGIQLQCAQGFLLSQFLSPATNKRSDAYGGSIANRMRLVKEICTAIRACTQPDFVLSIKMNSVEFQKDGLTTEDAAELVKGWQDAAVDYVELSGGTFEQLAQKAGVRKRESTKKREAFFLEFAERIVPALGPEHKRKTKVVVTGGLRTAEGMLAALEVVDAVGIARPAVQEPALAGDLLDGRVTSAIWPVTPFDSDFILSVRAAYSQIRAIGQGYEPFDLSDEEVAGKLTQDLHLWWEWFLSTKGDVPAGYGHADYTGRLVPHRAC
ncbi:NADH oxidase [Diaporthe amygdali]|uniref:NADH oxidase n=1 Tax=Phomopsis amygdali TaxID=1214568 RepID=UPI0022FE7A32|nr:NADH oxidase [Diaporthe amygdali]KAJ0123848.1 NADH oxidase [Diaporthe amygdali]